MNWRLEFTRQTKREAWARAGGVCECHRCPDLRTQGCGVKLTERSGIHYDHINPDAIKQDNSLENCAVLTKTCHQIKTSLHDIPTIAKSNRLRDRARGIK